MDRVAPLLIGPANAIQACGVGWEWVADQCVRLRVPFLGTSKKRVVNAAAFLAALESEQATPQAETPAPTTPDEIRRRLGIARPAA